jgi:hypothetical protein
MDFGEKTDEMREAKRMMHGIGGMTWLERW